MGMHLDVDVVDGHGPETVTLDAEPQTRYHFAVHNYSNDGTITSSRAKIDVYGREGLLASFDVPSEGKGRWWNVFSLDGATWARSQEGGQECSSLDAIEEYCQVRRRCPAARLRHVDRAPLLPVEGGQSTDSATDAFGQVDGAEGEADIDGGRSVPKTAEAAEAALAAEIEAETEAALAAEVEEAEAAEEAEAEKLLVSERAAAGVDSEMEAEMDALLEEMVTAADPELHELIEMAENLSELVVHPSIGCTLCGMYPLVGSRFTKNWTREPEGQEENFEVEGGSGDVELGDVPPGGPDAESVQVDLCSACFLCQPEAEQAAFTELTHPSQACHDEREWVPGCIAREDEVEPVDKRAEKPDSEMAFELQ